MSTVTEPVRTNPDPLEDIPTLPDEPVTRRDIFYRAADLLLDKGWTKWAVGCENPDGPYCLLGAVAAAAELEMVSLSDGPSWSYLESGRIVDPSANSAHMWSFNDKQEGPSEVFRVLFSLADGATWEEATA